MKTGIERIADERKRQIEEEDWTAEHDKQHSEGELADAAACYAMTPAKREMYQSYDVKVKKWIPRWFPFMGAWWKPTAENRIRELEKAGALCAAEIDRLQAQQI